MLWFERFFPPLWLILSLPQCLLCVKFGGSSNAWLIMALILVLVFASVDVLTSEF